VTLAQFVAASHLSTLTELARSCHLAFYHLKKESVAEFTANDCAKWIGTLSLPKPNTSRLADKLKASGDTVKGAKPGYFRLHHTYLQQMDATYPQLSEKSQEVIDEGTILPPVLYQHTRGYIESLAKQINGSYEHNIFDGCAVLIRRLEEVLLILAYDHLGIAAEIKDGNDNYFLLEKIVKNAEANPKLNLSRNSKKSIDVFRELGNYSAHKITYTCRREYIKEKIDEYRALVDELLHKAGIRT
jgi:hypothetical protein